MVQGRKADLKQQKQGCKHDYRLEDESMTITCANCEGQLTIGDLEYSTQIVHAMQKSDRGSGIKRGPDNWEIKRRPHFYE